MRSVYRVVRGIGLDNTRHAYHDRRFSEFRAE